MMEKRLDYCVASTSETSIKKSDSKQATTPIIVLILPLIMSLFLGCSTMDLGEEIMDTPTESIEEMVERGLSRARSQALTLAKIVAPQKGMLPRTFEDGLVQQTGYWGWVSGFFPGVLWMLYEDSQDSVFRDYAELFTARVEPAKSITSTHDLGFMLYCSFGNGYRITADSHYLDVIKEGTRSLITRWNPNLGVMMSWNPDERWKYPVIIDNMMNLEMLCFMSKITGDDQYRIIAETHANTTIHNHFRKDGSSWHVVSYDPTTGLPHAKNTSQGYSDGSAWARGQAWGLYGYTMMYRETQNPLYLNQACLIANYLTNHPRLPHDKVPYWDFDAPDIPDAYRDASSAAIMSSALLELSQLDQGRMSSRWYDLAVAQLRSLSSPYYLAEQGEQGGFILRHCVGHLPAGAEVDVPLTYADYYYIEALLRLKRICAIRRGAN